MLQMNTRTIKMTKSGNMRQQRSDASTMPDLVSLLTSTPRSILLAISNGRKLSSQQRNLVIALAVASIVFDVFMVCFVYR